MSTDDIVQEYMDKLPGALLNFQWIEEALRQYLGRTEFMIASEVIAFMSYKIDTQEFEKASLGTLLKFFRRRNQNKDLHKLISELVQDRNFCAHAGYLHIHESKDDPKKLKEASERLDKVITESKKCLHMLFAEIRDLENRFIAHKQKNT
jgi:hypothetical protein